MDTILFPPAQFGSLLLRSQGRDSSRLECYEGPRLDAIMRYVSALGNSDRQNRCYASVLGLVPQSCGDGRAS